MNKKAALLAILNTLVAPQLVGGALALQLPDDSGTSIALDGTVAQGFGVTGFMNEAEGQANSGHLLEGVVLNAPIIPDGPGSRNLTAHYYISGRGTGPFPNGGTDAAFTSGLNNFNSTQTYVNDQALNLSLLTFRFGPSNGQATSTWNLGADVNGQNWSGNIGSSVEERIYTANPADVSSGLFYNNTQVLEFGYSDVYEILDYGGTMLGNDDTIVAYSDPVNANKSNGLVGVADGLADALLADIGNGGGQVQLRFTSFQPISSFTDENGAGDGLWPNNLGFAGAIQVVPEPEEYGFLFACLLLGMVLVHRDRQRRAQCAIVEG